MGAIFFSILMGVAISPAILGAAWNVTYVKTLHASLPETLKLRADESTMASLGNSRVLLSKQAMEDLESQFKKMGGEELFPQTVRAIRASMEAGLKSVFWVGAITMLISFLLISTIPEVSMNSETEANKFLESAAPSESVAAD